MAESTKISYLYKKGYFVNFQLTLFSFVSDSAFQVVTEELMGGEGGGGGGHRGSEGGWGGCRLLRAKVAEIPWEARCHQFISNPLARPH